MKKILLLTSLVMAAFTGSLRTVPGYKGTLSRVYSSRFVGQEQQWNAAGEQGTLYTAFGMNGSTSIDTQLSGGQAQAIQVLSDGSFVVALSKSGAHSVLAKYSAQAGIVSSSVFGTNGVADLGANTEVAQAMMLDSQHRILAAGGGNSGTAGWIKRVSADGDTVTSFTTGTSWQFVGALAQQSSGKIIAVGFNGSNAQIARYGLTGELDSTFGFSGFIIFDGSSGRPTSTNGLYNVVVDGDENIYVAYLEGTIVKVAKFDRDGTLVDGFGAGGIATITYLPSATAQTIRMAMDYVAELVIGATVGSEVWVTNIQTSNGSIGSWGAVFETNVFNQLTAIVPTNDGKILLLGSDTISRSMTVMRLTQYGGLDNESIDGNSSFNGTLGYNRFNIANPTTSSILCAGSIAPTGMLYAVGYQVTGATPTVTPYVSALYNAPYVAAIAQYPQTTDQGNIDTAFGDQNTESISGVLMPYNGFFGDGMQQKTRTIIELPIGTLLVGYDGKTDASNSSTMMLARLTSNGFFDTSFGQTLNGKLTLDALGTMNSLAVSGSGTVYVAGTNAIPKPVLYAYTSDSTRNWTIGNSSWNVADTGTDAVGIALQGTSGILLFCKDSSIAGHMSRYTTDGTLDTRFGLGGTLSTAGLGLNMGPVYGGGIVDDDTKTIYIAYKNSLTNAIDLAAVLKDGQALASAFGISGKVSNIFGSTSLTPSNVRIAFGKNNKLIVAAVNAAGTAYLIGCYNHITGAVDTTFNNGNILSITPESTSTSLALTNLVGLSDGSIMVTGYDVATDPVMLTLRITATGVLDTTFNPQGQVPGVLPLQIQNETANYIARNLSGIAVQTSSENVGNLVLTAFEQQSSTLSTPEVMRVYGKPDTTAIQRFPTQDQYPGTLDVSFNGCGAQNITDITALGTGKVVYAYPAGSPYAGMLLMGVNVSGGLLITRVDEATLQPDTTFGDRGVYALGSYTGLNNIMVDNHNKIILCGTQSGAGWALQIPRDADDSPVVFAMPSTITDACVIYQQCSGRYILAGAIRNSISSTVGVLVAFQNQVVFPATQLAIDTTFNPLETPGMWVDITTTVIPSMTINYDDTILLSYSNSSQLLCVAKLAANGSALVDGFGINGVKNTGIAVTNATSVRVASNNASSSRAKVIVATVSGSALEVIRYTAAGATDTTWNAGGTATTITGVGSAGISLTSLLITENDQTILTGYNTTGTPHGKLFAVRLNADGFLDSTWNPNAVTPDLPGILTFGAANNPLPHVITTLYQAYIALDGNIFAIGSSVIGDDIAPILMEIVGDSYVEQVSQSQVTMPAGILDRTLVEPDGALNLNTAASATLGAARRMYIDINGYFYLASNYSGSLTNVTKLLPTFAPDTSFGTNGIVNISNAATCYDMLVADAQGDDGLIYLTGSNAGSLWVATVTADGTATSLTLPTSMSTWTAGYAIRKNSAGNIVVAGFDGAHGAVAEILANGTQVASLFGTNGVYSTASTNSIVAMTVDNQSRIYIAYLVSGATTTINIQRLTSQGILDTAFGTQTLTGSNLSATQIKMALDSGHNNLVVVAQDGTNIGNALKVKRFSTIDGSAAGSSNGITFASEVVALSDIVINTDEQIYVIGTNTTNNKVVVARFNSTSSTTIALDATYGTYGIANISITGPMTYAGGQLNPDGRMYIAGNGTTAITATSYLSRLFGDNYYKQVSQATQGFAPGLFDPTYGIEGIAQTYAGGFTANQQARAILSEPTGAKIMALVQNTAGDQAWTVRILPNGINDSVYGNGQGIPIAQATTGTETIQNMIFNGNNVAMIVGNNSVNGGFVKSVLPNGAMNASSFGGILLNQTIPGAAYFTQFDSINAIAQLSTGSYVIGGSKNGIGIISLLAGSGQVINSFGSNGFVTAGMSVTSLSVDADNNIYAAYTSASDDVLVGFVLKLNPSGTPVASYGTQGMVDVFADVNNSSNLRLALDKDGKIVIAACVNGTAASVGIVRLDRNGSIDTTFNGGEQFVIELADNTSAGLANLVTLENGKILVAGYQYDANEVTNDDYEFVAAISPTGTYDTEFNAGGFIPGIVTFQIATVAQQVRNLWNMSVQRDGQILLAGSEETIEDVTTPLTMRMDGYSGVMAVQQFPGYTTTVPDPLMAGFGVDGLAYAPTHSVIDTLTEGGQTVVDSQKRIIIAGKTTAANTFVVARFLQDGTLDQDFGTAGIASTPTLTTLQSGSYVTVDSSDRVYVAGVSSDNKFMVARFTTDGMLDTANFDAAGTVPGIAVSGAVMNAPATLSGGYICLDYQGKIILGGLTSDFKLAVARFTTAGLADNTFGTAGIAKTDVISNINTGGYVASPTRSLVLTDDGSVYVGAVTHAYTLLVVKFDQDGVLDNNFGTNGIATSSSINNLATGGYLVDGGSVALTSQRQIVVGGYTSDKRFVAGMFTSQGELSDDFGIHGIAYSQALSSLDACANLWIDTNDNIIFGGIARAMHADLKMMVVSRFTNNGAVDTYLSPTGTVTTGVIEGLQSGGFVCTNIFNQIFAGGYVGDRLVLAGIYSGAEVIIENPQLLSGVAYAIYQYGNNPDFYKKFFALDWYALGISNGTHRILVLEDINNSFDEYASIYESQPEFNLAACAYPCWGNHLLLRAEVLKALYPSSSQDISVFIDSLFARMQSVRDQLVTSPLNSRGQA